MTESDFIPDGRDAAAPPGFVLALARAVQAARLYEPAHPLVGGQVAAAVKQLHTPGGEWMIGVGAGCLFIDATEFDAPEELRLLAEAWHHLDVGVVRVSASAGEADLRGAVAAWAEALQHKTVDVRDLVDRVASRSGGAVTCVPLDYDRIRVQDASDRREASGGRAFTWNALVESLLDPSGNEHDGQEQLQAAARWIGQEAGRDADGTMRLLHDRLHRAAQTVNAQPDDAQQAEKLARISSFVETLTPALRKALLDAAPSALADTLPNADGPPEAVLSALAALDGNLTQATRQSLLMCAKLAALGAGQERNQGESTGESDDETGVGASLQELLTQHDPTDYTPPDYLRQLEQVATDAAVGEATAWSRRHGEAFAGPVLRLHAAHIAIHLTETYVDDAGPCPEPMSFLARAAEDLVANGSLPSVAAAVRAAQTRLTRGGAEPVLEAARLFLERAGRAFDDPGVLDRLLEDGGSATDVGTLLRLSPPEMLVDAARRAVSETAPQSVRSLRDALRSLGPAALEPAVGQLRVEDPARLPRLVELLGPMPFKMATRWLGTQLTQNDPSGRAAAFAALFAGSPTWPADAAETLLNHPDRDIRDMALERLLGQDDDASQAVLGRVLGGQFEDGVPEPALIDRVATVLLSRGDAGVEALAGALKQLSGVFHPRRSRCAAQIADHMAKSGHADAVGAARRWSRSAAAIWARGRRSAPEADRGRAA